MSNLTPRSTAHTTKGLTSKVSGFWIILCLGAPFAGSSIRNTGEGSTPRNTFRAREMPSMQRRS